ncbi:GAF domain-containing protein [Aquimarina sp. ERC-38]|uniref:GAF domain-containing protein n=1 Tax=Aquimarina sp. ERC-38 TaxID=2949996 RepID=UPI0022457EF4|nr:GAF domain-containing protein [Aquimarina sp. ERC-38]UZO79555.1 GAF domain-containing protein [Aquimarina sp. ERC-38]
MANTTLVSKINNLLSTDSIDWELILKEIISAFDCETGTLHFLDTETNLLQLQAQIGIPAFLLPKLTTIPIGKGMAGIAAERKEPVEMCNLQLDESGIARPAAKETKVEGSIAAPLLHKQQLYGTIGIAKKAVYIFTKEETETLMEVGEALAAKYIDILPST